MFLLKKILSAWLLPPLGFLLLALVTLLFFRRRKYGVLVAGILLVLVFAMSLPIVADGLSRTLEGAPISAAELTQAQAIVVLGCGVYRGAPEYGGDTVSRCSLASCHFVLPSVLSHLQVESAYW